MIISYTDNYICSNKKSAARTEVLQSLVLTQSDFDSAQVILLVSVAVMDNLCVTCSWWRKWADWSLSLRRYFEDYLRIQRALLFLFASPFVSGQIPINPALIYGTNGIHGSIGQLEIEI